jgi:hypothetical protein
MQLLSVAAGEAAAVEGAKGGAEQSAAVQSAAGIERVRSEAVVIAVTGAVIAVTGAVIAAGPDAERLPRGAIRVGKDAVEVRREVEVSAAACPRGVWGTLRKTAR